jgi:hypothetical protein
MKSNAFLIGNCQAQPLRYILKQSKNFSRFFTLNDFPAVHIAKLEDVKRLYQDLEDCSLLITQPISDLYRDSIGLGTSSLFSIACNSNKITYPSLYFSGYNPELFYLKSADGRSINIDFDYHCKIIFKSYLDGYSIQNTYNTLFDNNEILNSSLADISFSIIRKREQLIDIKISDFIEKYYQAQRLFLTFNHPSTSLLKYVAAKILSELDLSDDVSSLPIPELLDGTVYPILPRTQVSLKLKFSIENGYKIRRQKFTEHQIIEKYFTFYTQNPELVNQNST